MTSEGHFSMRDLALGEGKVICDNWFDYGFYARECFGEFMFKENATYVSRGPSSMCDDMFFETIDTWHLNGVTVSYKSEDMLEHYSGKRPVKIVLFGEKSAVGSIEQKILAAEREFKPVHKKN